MPRPHAQNLTAFPGHSTADASFHTTCDGYGLQSNSTPYMARLAECLHATLQHFNDINRPAAAKSALRAYICEPELLSPEQCIGSASTYRRHLLYVSPAKDFSVMSVVWQPGQRTPIHGHTAWGSVGVYSGQPFCVHYLAKQSPEGVLCCEQMEILRLKPRDLATVQPGLGTIHRIGNDSLRPCVTVHIYGTDLLADPAAINFQVAA